MMKTYQGYSSLSFLDSIAILLCQSNDSKITMTSFMDEPTMELETFDNEIVFVGNCANTWNMEYRVRGTGSQRAAAAQRESRERAAKVFNKRAEPPSTGFGYKRV